MKQLLNDQLDRVLKHLYINPLEKCNLRCAICYTRKTSPMLSDEDILTFLARYEAEQTLETITFCGGEVFALPYFVKLVNILTEKNIFIQIITNGTIDRLDQFTRPNFVNLIVSLDGLPAYHDKNRGAGNFEKSLNFLKHGQELGFHREIFSIVTKQNIIQIDAFEQYLKDQLRKNITVTYHPRKPPMYLLHHPVSNVTGEISGFDFLNPDEMKRLLSERNTFPPKELGCYQIALVSDGKVYGCCEGVTPIGEINDGIGTLKNALRDKIICWEQTYTKSTCLGCAYPDFVCGMKQYLNIM